VVEDAPDEIGDTVDGSAGGPEHTIGQTRAIGDGFCAEAAQIVVIPLRGRADDTRAGPRGDLHGEAAHSPGRTVDEDGSALEGAERLESAQGSASGQGQA